MQPTLVLTAPAPGIVRLNGRFAGEIAPGRPLVAPVAPFGALYMEYAPLSGGAWPMARKIVFSGGAPMAETMAEAEGLACVAWPGGALEIECIPAQARTERFALEGHPCAMTWGEAARLEMEGLSIPLPATARAPRLTRLGGLPALVGETDGGQYLVTLDAGMTAATGFLAGEAIDFASGDMVNALVALGDSVGHGRLEQWIADGNGLSCVSSEPVWTGGAPRWPRDAEGAMIAAVEAELAGLDGEARGYLAPGFGGLDRLAEAVAGCDVCVPMRYAPPDARACVGLLTAVNDRLAVVRPLYYRAVNAGGAQGNWKIEEIEA